MCNRRDSSILMGAWCCSTSTSHVLPLQALLKRTTSSVYRPSPPRLFRSPACNRKRFLHACMQGYKKKLSLQKKVSLLLSTNASEGKTYQRRDLLKNLLAALQMQHAHVILIETSWCNHRGIQIGMQSSLASENLRYHKNNQLISPAPAHSLSSQMFFPSIPRGFQRPDRHHTSTCNKLGN